MANLDELRRVLLEMASPNTLRDGVVTLLDDVRGLVASRERHRDTQVVHHARIDQLASGCSETSTRVDQLAAQLAGLQRLVESLVNERGEGRRQETADDESRCAVCGWPLKADIDEGCVREVCSAGDPPKRKYAPQRFALEQLRFRAARIEIDRDRLRAEVERLTALAESRWKWAHDVAGVTESQTVEAIAAWLEQRAQAILTPNRHCLEAQHRAAGLTDAVDDLRAGTWREQP